MKTRIQLHLVTTLALAATASSLRAQLVADSATRTLINETNSITGSVTVGTNGSFTLLVVSDNALLTNSGVCNIGLNSTARSNEVRLVSPSARWRTANNLYVGNSGPFNRLVVSNGGLVASFQAVVGLQASASNTLALVTGAGSLWSNTTALSVGGSSHGNQLVVSNGGTVVMSAVGGVNSVVGDAGDNNRGVVTGAGSVWSNAGGFFIGFSGNSNRMSVKDGGWLVNGLGVIGEVGQGNEVTVAEAGSVWSNRLDQVVGRSGQQNQLIVSNGATAFVGGNALLGTNSGANSNSATVTGPGSRWLVAGNLRVGVPASFCRLFVSDGARVEDASGFVGSGDFASNNLAVVAGAGSVWSNASSLFVGNACAGNQLVVSNGAAVFGNEGVIGYDSSGSNNLVTVTGAGSVWSNATSLFIGDSSTGNQLVVSNGAGVFGYEGLIGYISSSSNNLAVVTGAGSVWSNAVDLFVGNDGRGNQLIVSNGGSVRGLVGTIGLNTSSSNNVATVTGAGSVWSNANSLFVGNAGAGNQLLVSNGGMVMAGIVAIGNTTSASSNSATVSGSGTSWLVSSNLYLGSNGAFNLLVVSNGGRVTDDSGILGFSDSSIGNMALVTGAGSVWSNVGSLVVGRSGSGNQLVVSNGASVSSSIATMAIVSSSSNNQALVTGPGSVWNCGSINVGESGSGNHLTVSEGGVVRSSTGNVGSGPTSSTNLAVVTGPGSLWTNSNELTVGGQGPRNQLVVSNGGAVVAFNTVRLGNLPTSFANRIEINGGSLRVNNTFSLGTGVFDINRGTNVLHAGFIEANHLLMTNALGVFQFHGGTVSARNSTVGNGQPLTVGNGVSSAMFVLAGNGVHVFVNGFTVSSNAVVTGNGSIAGTVTVVNGGQLNPGASVGKIVLSNSPSLQGTVIMEISKNGATLTNDQIQIIAPLTYGGALVVSNLGPTALAAGDRFPLFSATSYTNTFSVITLPPLPSGLDWTNKLAVDGSIEVVVVPVPQFTSISLSGTNVVISGTNGTAGANYAVLTATNVTTPLNNWVSIVTNQFGTGGSFSFTNPIAPGIPQRYFRIRTP